MADIPDLRAPTVNWLVHGVITLALLFIGNSTNQTLDTVRSLDKGAAVQVGEISHIKSDIIALSVSINQDLEGKYSRVAGERQAKRLGEMEDRLGRMWDVINSIRSFDKSGAAKPK